MNAKLSVALIAVVLAVVGFFSFYEPNSEAPEEVLTPGIDPPVAEVATEPVEDLGQPDDAAALAPEEQADSRASVEADERPAWTREPQARELEGRVVLPTATPTDELLFVKVTALKRPQPSPATEPEAGPAASSTATSSSEPELAASVDMADLAPFVAGEAPQPRTFAGAQDETPDYSVRVEADGSFRFFTPNDRLGFRLELEGRYLYLDEPFVQPARPVGPEADAALYEAPAVELTARLGGWLDGRLMAPAGVADEPAEIAWDKARVRTGIDASAGFSTGQALRSQSFSRRAEPESDGHYEFKAFPADQSFGLEVEVPGMVIELIGGLELAPGEHRTLDVDLRRGVRVAGTVVDEDGQPIDNADVNVRAGERFDIRAQRMARDEETDADGRFEVAGVAGGKQQVEVQARGYLQGEPITLELAEGEVLEDLTIVLSGGAHVAGQVLDAGGRPLARVRVELSFDPAALNGLNAMNAGIGADGRDRTDEDGRFRIQGLGKGPFLVKAEHTDDQENFHYAEVAGIQPGDEELLLQLRELTPLAGRVVDRNGDPVPAFAIELQAGSLGGLMAGNARSQAFENPEGRFAFEGIREGQWNVYVRSPEYGLAGPIAADRPGAGDSELLITLERGVTVRGSVVGPDGEPVPGASVLWQADAGDMVLNIVGTAPSITGRTEADGSFELAGLPSGNLTLVASSDHFAKGDPLSLEAEPEEVVEDALLLLLRGGVITGEYLDDEGEPGEGALIQIQRPGGTDQRITQSDAKGWFRVERMEPGSWQVIGIGGSMEGAADDPMALLKNLEMEMVEVVDGEEVHVVLGKPPEDPVHLTGEFEPAEEAAGGIAILIPEGTGILGSMEMASIDADGRFEMDLEKPGKYVVTFQTTPDGGVGQDSVEYLETIPEGPEHHLKLKLPGGAVTGRLTGPDGAPLRGVRVSLYTDSSSSTGTVSGGKYTEGTSDEDGNYHIGHLQAGSYTVGAGGRSITAVFDEQGGYGRQVQSGVAVKEGQTVRGIDFELDAAGAIAGRIVNSTGSPVGGASIFVRSADGNLLERISLQTSGPDGRFRYSGVAPGAYTISARSSSEASPTETSAQVSSGEEAEVELTLVGGTMIEVIVENKAGEPMVAEVQVLDERGNDLAGHFGMADLTALLSGDFSTTTRRFGPLPPGKYKVLAQSGSLSAKKPLTLKGQEERRVRIRLK